ncbi:MAG: DNRLRE domain-containing protein, partial [Clostridiales Family XIII bacterium]|nr:DNRLRE domain-containing protein [Clostridiales Family XIII bacterium]
MRPLPPDGEGMGGIPLLSEGAAPSVTLVKEDRETIGRGTAGTGEAAGAEAEAEGTGDTEETVGVARYEGVLPGVDLVYEALPMGVKETVALKRRPDTGTLRFEILSEGVPVPLSGGGIAIVDGQGATLGGIAPPDIRDSAPGAASVEDASAVWYEVSPDTGADGGPAAGSHILTLHISNEYLDDPARTYPVLIDPTYTVEGEQSIRSVNVRSASPGTNFFDTSCETMQAGFTPAYGWTRSLFRFNTIADVLRGATLDSAQLRMTRTGGGQTRPQIFLHETNSLYDAAYVTWDSKPTHEAGATASGQAPASGGVLALDVTALVERYRTGTAGLGVYLMTDEGDESVGYAEFGSGAHPYGGIALEVAYTLTADSAANGRPPSMPSLVEVDPAYVPGGFSDTVPFFWEGIEADWDAGRDLAALEMRIEPYGEVRADGLHVPQDMSGIPYFEPAGIDVDSDGEYGLDLGGLAEGCYLVRIRGVDDLGR